MLDLCFDACHVAQEISDGLYWVVEGFEPKVMGDDAAPSSIMGLRHCTRKSKPPRISVLT
jgi:hypothetical protein